MEATYIPGAPGQYDYIDIDGHRFRLDRRPEPAGLLSALPRYRQAFEAVPDDKVQESDPFPIVDAPTLYQEQNGCTGHAGSTAFHTIAYLCGEDIPEGGFSPTWSYALINDGQDNGAIIARLIRALQAQGMCTNAKFGEKEYFLSQASADDYETAKQYLLDDAYAIDSEEELRSALSRGWPVVDSVQVGRNFSNLVNGTTAGVDVGYGNHAVAKAGLLRFQGRTYYRNQNSWGPTFGKGGRFYTTREHILSQRDGRGNPTYTGVVFRSVKPFRPRQADESAQPL